MQKGKNADGGPQAEVSNRPKAFLPPHSSILGGKDADPKTTSGSSSEIAINDEAESTSNKQARIDEMDDISDKHDRSLDSLAREVEQDMEDDEMPPAYSPVYSRPDSPDSGFADVPSFEDALQTEEPAWSKTSAGLENGNAGSSWMHVDWTTLGKSAPPVNSSRTSSTGDNFVEVAAEDSRQNSVMADDDMVVVEKAD